MFADTPICDRSLTADLRRAFENHVASYSGDHIYALGCPETEWPHVIRDRARRDADARLRDITNQMLNMLAAPRSAGEQWTAPRKWDTLMECTPKVRHAKTVTRASEEGACRINRSVHFRRNSRNG